MSKVEQGTGKAVAAKKNKVDADLLDPGSETPIERMDIVLPGADEVDAPATHANEQPLDSGVKTSAPVQTDDGAQNTANTESSSFGATDPSNVNASSSNPSGQSGSVQLDNAPSIDGADVDLNGVGVEAPLAPESNLDEAQSNTPENNELQTTSPSQNPPAVTAEGEEINVAPVDIAISNDEIAENAAGGAVIATLSTVDGNVNDQHTYAIINDPSGFFEIVGDEIRVKEGADLDFEVSPIHELTIEVTDSAGNTFSEVMTINLADVNEFDVSSISDTDGIANAVSENASDGDAAGLVASAFDADGTNSTVTYSLTDDAGGIFTIDEDTGEVTIANASGIDYENATSHTIEVTATSADGSSSTQNFTIDITDFDEHDVGAISDTDASANTIAENVSNGDSVGITASAIDADGSNNSVTYSLSDDAGGIFAIDTNTGEVSIADASSIDYETATSHTIEVTATSEDGSTSTQNYTINVSDVDEFDVSAVSDNDGASNAVDEDASIGDTVGITALASDGDATDNVTYSLSDDAGGLFDIDASTGVVTVAGSLDAETATSHTIEVTATSDDGSTSTQTFSIGVDDVNETSITAISDTDGSGNSVTEGASVGTAVGITAFASDADVTDTVSYSLSSNPGGFFAIDANTGEVTVASALDYETDTSHTIEVTATSTDGTTSTQVFTIAVGDEDEHDVSAISDTDGSVNTIAENVSNGDSVGITASAIDADGTNNSVTYSLSDDAGGIFTIDGSTGEVTVADASSIDYETATSHTIEVTATSEDGSTSTQNYTINVADIDEFDVSAVSDNDGASNAVDEDASVGDTVGITALASDGDGTDNVTYSLSNDAGGLFDIDASTGVVTVAGSLDAETDSSHTIEVTATSDDGSTSTQTFSIGVNDVNETSITAISDTDGSGNSVTEGASVGTAVGITAFASDADATDTVSYSLSSNPGGFFAIDANTGEVTVAGSLDYETDTSHTIEVTATSTDGTTSTQSFTIAVGDEDEHDVGAISDTDGNANSVDENAAAGTTVGIVASATDADGSNSDVTYSLSDDAGGLFAIDATTGEVTTTAPLDAETASSYDIEVTATSEDGSTSSTTFTVDVNNLMDEGPTDIVMPESHSVVIENAGFEDQTFSDGGHSGHGGSSDSISGWTHEGVQNGAWNPTNDSIVNSGDNVAYIDKEGTISQELNETFGPGESYSATAHVRANSGNNSWEVRLYAGDQLIGSIGDEDISVGSSMTEVKLELSADQLAQYSDYFGENLTIELYSDGTGANVHFDDISLNVVAENLVSENATDGTAVTQVQGVVDVDAGDTHTFALLDDADGVFAIDADTGMVTVADSSKLDFENADSHNITIEVTDAGGNTYSEVITIGVVDHDEHDVGAISDTDSSANTIAENVSNGDSVGITASAIDADGTNNSVTYSLSDDAGGIFAIDTNTGEVSIADASGIDYESATSHTIEVTATSEDGSTSTQNYTINVTDVDEFDVSAVSDNDGASNAVDEDASVGDTVGITALASDGDGTDNVLYSLSDDAGGLFDIDASTGVVTVAGSLDAETDTSHTIEVTATSDDGSTSTQTFSIGVNDVNETSITAISDTDGTGNSVTEGASVGTAVGITAFASDADETDTVSYSLSSNPGGFFAIDANTGEVTVASALDYETDTSHTIEVTATSTDGTTSTQVFTIAVGDEDEHDVGAISDTDATANAVDENAATGTTVGVVASASDADGSNSDVTYSLSDDAGGLFTIDATTGEVTTTAPLDAETASSYDIEVTATSEDGSTSTTTFTVDVNNLMDEGPTDITFTGGTVNETVTAGGTIDNAYDPSGSTVATLSATDADSGDTFTYAITNDPSGHFEIVGNEVRVKSGQEIDFETAESHDITIEVTDAGGNTYSETITINVQDFEGSATGTSDSETFTGTSEEDVIDGESGGDTIYAGAGDDSISGGDGWDDIYAGDGDDYVDGGLHNDDIDGGAGNDTLLGYHGADKITGGEGDDVIDGGTDTVGDDTAVYSGNWSDYTITESAGTYTIADNRPGSPDGTDTVTNVENFEFADGTVGVADLLDVGPSDIDVTSNSVDENSASGTIVATLSATDNALDSHSYAITNDPSGFFEISGDKILVKTGAALDTENAPSHDVTIEVTDANGNTYSETITINVNDLDEFDVSAVTDTDNSANTIAENASAGDEVGVTASASDADATNSNVTYSVDDARFEVAADGTVTVASGASFDAETEGSIDIEVTATSEDGSTSSETFTINVSDIDEFDVSAVSDNDGMTNAVDEDASVGDTVGITALASDGDVTDNVTYSLSDNAGGLFDIDASTGVVTVAGSLDAETDTSHTIEVTATSDDGSTSTQTFSIGVNDVNETSITAISDTDGTGNSVTEGASVGTAVGITAFASDADATDTISYSLSSNPGSFFAIDANTGEVTVASALDYETDTSHTIEVTATSTDGTTSTQVFTIAVGDEAETVYLDDGGVTFTDTGVTETSVVGGTGDDNITGTSGDDVIAGNSGDDVVNAGDGNDKFDDSAAGNGNDTVNMGAGDDFAYGGDGSDVIDGGTGEDFIHGEDGDDTLTGGADDDTIRGGDGNDIAVFSGDRADYTISHAESPYYDGGVWTVTGPDGTDTVMEIETFRFDDGDYSASDLQVTADQTIVGTVNDDVLNGGSGNDTISGLTGDDVVNAGAGDDRFDDTSTGNGNDTLNMGEGNDIAYGGDGTDTISGDEGDDTLYGESGDDRIEGGEGNDAIDGGADDDTVVFSGNWADYTITESGGTYTVVDNRPGSPDGTDTVRNVEFFEFADGTTTADDVIDVGPSDIDVSATSIDENSSAGTVVATLTATDNTLDVQSYTITNDPSGFFEISGDQIVVKSGADIDFEDATSHDITVEVSDGAGSTYSETFTINVNNLMDEGPTDITFTGGTVNETVELGGTIDSAYDPSGSTVATLSATDADSGDTFTYAITNDPSGHFEIVGNEVRVKSGQTIDFETAESHDITIEVTDAGGNTYSETITINVQDYEGSYTATSAGETVKGTQEEDTLNAHADGSTIDGGGGEDTITGGASADDLSGGRSDDTIHGGGGNDVIDGGDGDDLIYGGDGDDIIEAGDDIDFGDDDVIYGGDGNDTITSSETDSGSNDTFYGEAGNDTITSQGGADLLDGGTGDDRLSGGTGDDTIEGGDDTDTAVYSGNWSDYTITESAGTYTIVDNRPGSPDGTDTVTNVENFEFADGTVGVTDLLDVGPSDIDVTSNSVDENSASGTVVATLSATDNALDSHSYAITNDPSGFFEISGDQILVKAGAALDTENAPSHDVTIEVTDANGNTYSETITINVNDLDEFDVSAVTDTDGAANTIAENASAGDEVGVTASASDADATNSNVTYSVDDARFEVAADGTVTVASGASFDAETEGSIDIEVTATSEDGSTSSETFTINVSDIDEFDVSAVSDNDGTSNAVDEDASVGDTVGITALASDGDATDNVTYSLSDDAGGLFDIDASTGVVTVAGSLDAETDTSHTIEVTATSDDGSTSTQTFSIGVNDVNETSITAISDTDGSGNSVTEGASVGTAVGITAFASDADETDTISYSLSSNPGGFFAIDANTGEVTVASALDYETDTSHTIEVTATSSDGTTSTQSFTIAVGDEDEFDVGAVSDSDASANTIAENASDGDTVGITASATDADGSNNTVTYSLSDDAGGIFDINTNTGEVFIADSSGLDYENATSHTIEVTATSADGSTSTQSYTINVSDVDEFDVGAVSDSDASANTIAENASDGDTVGITASATDADGSNNTVTYSLSDDAGGIFDINTNTGEVFIADSSGLDYENATSHTIEVTATSADGSTSTQSYTINVTDVDEFDVGAVSDSDASANTIAENASDGDTVGITASATDADGSNNTVTYSLSDDAGGIFDINTNTGEVFIADSSGLDYENATSHTIEVTATSADGSTSTQSYTINVSDVDEFDVTAITDTDATANAVDENAAAGTTVGVVASASDADATNSDVTYSLSDDAGGLFTIDATTGEVTTTAPLDAETASSYDIEVTATSEDGSTSTTTFTVGVNNLMDEGPTDITFTGGTVNETVADGGTIDSAYDPSGSTVATLSATDADSGDTFTYAITNDPSGHFEIVGNEVRVKSGQTIDFETAESHDITIEVTDAGGNTYSETITINVQDFEGSATGTSSNESFTGTSEEDNISGGNGDDTIYGGDGDDTIDGGYGSDTIYGGAGDDVIYEGSDGQNAGILYGEEGNDTLYTGSGTADDQLYGGEGDDTLIDLGSADSRWDWDGSTGNDLLDGGAGNDDLQGGLGQERLIGGEGDDTIDGGDDTDTAVYSGNWSDYTITESGGTYTIVDNRAGSPDGTDTVTNVENFEFADGTVGVADLLDVGPTDIDVTSNSVDENSASGTVVATLSATDNALDSHSYAITNDPSGFFEISGDQILVKAGAALDTENASSHDITVEVTDGNGNTYSETITINVSDVDEFDVSAVSDNDGASNTVDEDASVGDTVGITALASDGDATDNVTYSLSDDAGGLFDIDASTGVVTVAGSLDAETATSHTIEVTATSDDGSTSTQTFSIGVNDINETSITAISDTDGTGNSVTEGASVGTAVGITAFASDADATDTVSYSLSSNPGGFFAIDANTGEVTVAGSLDYETDTSHTIEVTATSTDGTTSTQSFTIAVGDEDEHDVGAISDTDGSVNTIAENVSNGDSVGITASATDADGSNNTVTYSLSDDAGGIFTIDGSTGEVTVADASSIDYETATSHTIEVTATSADGSTSTQSYTINVSDVIDENPTDIQLTGTSGNLIQNGSFESFDVADGAYSLFASDSSGAWQTDTRMEVWDGHSGVTASDGEQHLELDAGTEVNSISQTITTTNGQVYDMSLDAMERSGTDGSDSIEIYWNGDLVRTIDPGTSWETVDFQVVGTGGDDVFEIREPSSESNGNGALIDNITMEEAPLTIAEGVDGAIIGTLTTTDADASDSHTYTISDARFEVVDDGSGNMQLKLKTGESFDYETETSVDITVTTTDGAGANYNEDFTITVADQSDVAPTDLSVDANENLDINTVDAVLNNAVVTGEIVHDGGSYGGTLGGVSVDHWQINHNGGDLIIDALADGYNGDDLDVKIMLYLDDGAGNFTLVASNDDGASGSDGSTSVYDSYISETNLAAGTYMVAVGNYHMDGSAATNTSMSHPGDDYSGSYNHGPYQLTISGNNTVEYYDHPSVSGTWGDPGGNAVVVSDGADVAASETIAAGSVIGSVDNVVDIDTNESFTYALTDDAGGKFEIDANTGEIKLVSEHDASTAYSDTVDVQVTDTGGNTYTETVGIQLGTDQGETLTGTSNSDIIHGFGGEDILNGGAGDDVLVAGDGTPGSVENLTLNDTGTDGVASVSNLFSVDLDEISFEVNLSVDNIPSSGATIVSYATMDGATAHDNEFTIMLQSDGSLDIIVNQTSQINTGPLTTDLTDGSEHRLSVTWDNTDGGIKVYVDGAEEYSITGIAQYNMIDGGGTLTLGQEQDSIGGGYDNNQIFSGTLDDVRIFNDVRTATEIANYHDSQLSNPSSETNLVANWQFDGESGTTVTDLANHYDLTLSGDASLEVGAIIGDTLIGGEGDDILIGGTGNDVLDGDGLTGLVLNDTGTDGVAMVSNVSGMPTTAITFEVMLNTTSLPSSGAGIISYAATGGSTNEFSVELEADGSISILVNGGSVNTGVLATSLADGDDHRLSISWDSTDGGVKVYIDGVEEYATTGLRVGHSIVGDGTLTFGQEQDTVGGGFDVNQIFQGEINDIRIFNDVRTAQEIADNSDTTLSDPLTETRLVSNWQFDGSDGVTATDLVGTNDLQISGDASINAGGDDVLIGGAGADVIDGGTGTDTASYEGSDSAVNVNLNTDVLSGGDAEGDTLTSIENVTGSDHDDTLTGDNANNTLTGSAGNDTLDGLSGKDTLDGGAGDDILMAGFDDGTGDIFIGGEGNDTYQIEGSTVENFAFNVDLNTGTDQYNNTYSGIENINGGNGDDTFTGDANANTFSGGAGNDTMYGGDESDIFVFGEGDGADTVHGGSGGGWTDTIELTDAGGDLGTYGTDWTVSLTSGSIDAQDANSLTLSDDADGTVTLADGSTVDFYEIERIEF